MSGAKLNRRAHGGYMRDAGAVVEAFDAFANVKAAMPRDRAAAVMAAFDRRWPRADYLDGIRHFIAEAKQMPRAA